MKFGHVIKYNMKNIFLEKSYKVIPWRYAPWSYTKYGGETIPKKTPFPKKSKLSVSLDQ